MKSIRILLQYLRAYKWLAVQNMGFNIISAFFALFTYTLIVPFLQILFKRVAPVPDPRTLYPFRIVPQGLGQLVLLLLY